MNPSIIDTPLQDLLIVTPNRFGDDRGWLSETWSRRALAEAGLKAEFVQDNHSYSASAGTLRGLHYQAPPHAQSKLVRCSRGSILDVAVDVRKGSPDFGKWHAIELSAANGRQLFVPEGFLHGFVTLEPHTEVQYKCSDYYAPRYEGCVLWNSLAIDWGLSGAPILSAKDAVAPAFEHWTSPFVREPADANLTVEA